MVKPRSREAFLLLASVYLSSIPISGLLIPFLYGIGCVMFVSIPLFCVLLIFFYTAAVCFFLGYRLDARTPIWRLSPLGLAMAALALPLAYRFSVYWSDIDPVSYIRQHGWN